MKGRFVPKNPDKYVGDKRNIVYRSSWEKLVMRYFDQNPAVLKWNSEECVVPYVSPVDNQTHRYFVDFWVKYRAVGGTIKEKLIEVKPSSQCEPPANKFAKNYKEAMKTFAVNQAKWEAARKVAASRGMEFQVMTENDLGIGRKPGR